MTMLYKKILVPLDGSEIAAQALIQAQALAEVTHAELILFCVMPEPEGQVVLNTELRFERIGDKTQAEMVEEAANKLQLLAEDLKHQHISASAIISTGDPASQIIDYTDKHDVDLIIMSTHGRTGLARWAYGSVASKVLTSAHCSVLLVRSHL